MTYLLGQGDDFERAIAAARALRLPHGLILEGPPGGGKSSAAGLLAQALLCGGDAGTELEGSCACSRRVASGQHADLQSVTRPEDRQDIPVDRVRELQGALERRPVEGRARVAIVDPADRLNEQGQNALLKTLEEPGEDTFLLLVTSRPEALLETVRSRAARLRILPLVAADLRAALVVPPEASPADIDFAVASCGGSLGAGARLLEPDARTLRTALETFLAAPTPTAVAAARGLIDGVSGRTDTEHRMGTLFTVLRALLRVRTIGSVDGIAPGGTAGYGAPVTEPWATALEVVFAAEQDFSTGIPPGQALEGMLLRLVGLLGGAHPVA